MIWFALSGTMVNVAAVAAGSLAGLSVAGKVSRRYRSIVLTTLGLVTITLGVDASVLRFARAVETLGPQVAHTTTYGARLAMVMIGSVVLGSILGTALRLHDRVEAMGRWLHGRFSDRDGHTFAEGFLTASVIFCIGPLTLIGCLKNGAEGDPSYLYIKSVLDGFCSMALASALGWGVLASIFFVLTFQGGLSLLAFVVAEPIDPVSLQLMTIVGGVLLLATALMILEIKTIPVADMLPGIFLPPILVWITEFVSPGTLLPLG